MCGIAGFFGNFEPLMLAKMSEALQSRGPDDDGIFFDPENPVGLAHRRLSIIDLSQAGHQPMSLNDGKITITYNGEIYNYQKLRLQLESIGHLFVGHSDTEVLLHAYQEFGLQFLDMLEGIFAFAIWDQRDKSLLVARDQFGVKPVYYAHLASRFVFASELKALLMCSEIPRDLDYSAVLNHLMYLYSPGKKTLLRHVQKLEPGYALRISANGEIKAWRYYDLPYGDVPVSTKSAAELAALVASTLGDAVNSQLVADVPVGAFLSGGLDSSAIVALAKDKNPDLDLQCFSIRLNPNEMAGEGFADDLPFAEKVARHCKVKLHVVNVDSTLIAELAEMIYRLDEPQADPAPLNVLAISKLARSHGIKVLLSGAGGDDLFTGYRRHYALQMERYWAFLPTQVRTWLKVGSAILPSKVALLRRVRKAFEYADLSADQRIASYFSWISPDIALGLMSSDSRSEIAAQSPFGNLTELWANKHNFSSNLQRMMYLEAKGFLPDHNLNYTDKMGMTVGVEIRVPFLDKKVVEVAASIPDSMKQNGRIGKYILKKAMEPYLPKDVIYRPKTGFGAPLRFWLNNQLKPLIDEMLSAGAIKKRGIFCETAVWNLIDADRKGRGDYAYTIFSLLCIELWFRMFIDTETPKIVTL